MQFVHRFRLVATILLITLVVSLLAVAAVSADQRTDMEVCAMHGLGPNFQYAEGPDSALVRCLARVSSQEDLTYGY